MAVRLRVLFGERLAELFGEQMAHVGGRHVDGRRDDMHRPLLGQLHDVLAQVGLDRADAGLLEHVVQLHLLADHRLRLHHAFDVVFAGRCRARSWLASAASLAQSTVAPRAVMFRSNSTSNLSRLAMA